MYMLEQGMCEVLVMGHGKNKETFIKDIGPGVIFGEVALLFDIPRTASVRSKQHCTLASIG
jgi:CRP-like cAMP-binding protein